jgi:hypothetical protein
MMSPEDEAMDAPAAADLIRQTQDQARRELRVGVRPVYAAWGLAWLAGLLAMWLSVRGQHPYRGPSVAAGVTLGVLIVAAIMVTMVTVIRAAAGIGGGSALQGRLYGLSWPIGFAALFAIERALAQHGAGPQIQGVLDAVGPLLVVSLIYLVAAAMWLDKSMFALGAWLALVSAVAAQTGPVTVLLVEALAAGAGFFAAALLARPYRP